MLRCRDWKAVHRRHADSHNVAVATLTQRVAPEPEQRLTTINGATAAASPPAPFSLSGTTLNVAGRHTFKEPERFTRVRRGPTREAAPRRPADRHGGA